MNGRLRNKRYHLIIFVLLLFISIGYAVLSSTVNIQGVSKIRNANWDIHFENIAVNDDSVPIVAANDDRAAKIHDDDNRKVSFAITLDKPGDFYEFTVDAVNDGTIDAMVDTVVSNLNGEPITELPSYLNYTVLLTSGNEILPNHLLASDTRETYIVRVEYKRDIGNDEVVGEEVTLNFDFTVNFKQADDSAVELIPYQVVHKYENLDGTYQDVIENLKGVAGSPVTPAVKPKTGFVSPNTQTVDVSGDGSTVVTYEYRRATYHFSIIDRTYIDADSTDDGDYLYETEITVKARARDGYTFKWNDNNTAYERTISLTSDLTLTPIYTAGDNTTYTVKHYLMDLDGVHYTLKEENTHSGTTNTDVTPDVNTYTGFESPATQTVPISGSGDTVVEYYYKRLKYQLTLTDSEYIETTTPTGKYYYKSPITLKAKTKDNYTFEKWTNNNTNSEISFELTDDVTIGPLYLVNSYEISFNANGGQCSTTSISVDRGESIGELPNATNTGYYLDGWYTDISSGVKIDSSFVPDQDIEVFARWKKSVQSLDITNSSIEIRAGDEETINITNSSSIEETYTFASNDSSIATVDSTGKVVGILEGNTTITITGDSSHQVRTIDVIVSSTTVITDYVVSFNANGGSVNPVSKLIPIGNSIGSLPVPDRDTYEFVGWYTSLTDGIQLDENFVPESDIEIFAKWNKIICKMATTLHQDECTRTSKGCYSAGFYPGGAMQTSTITFGKVSSGTFEIGNAYNCDINDDGVYSDDVERFYYIGASGDNAVLSFYSNFEGENGVLTDHNFNYSTALEMLPTTEQWPGINVSFDGKAARFPYLNEIESVFGITAGNSINGELNKSFFMFENSRFIDETNGRSGFWIKYADSYYRVHAVDLLIGIVGSTSLNVARPIIEVGFPYIDNHVDSENLVTVTFNSMGGNSIQPISVYKNTRIETLPEPTKQNFVFDGWYTDSNYSTVFNSDSIVSSDITVYAKWNHINGVASINGVGYTSLTNAIKAASTEEATTITLLQSLTGTSVTFPADKSIIFDLNGYSLSNDSSGVIVNKGILEIKNGIINTSSGTGAINNEENANITVNGVEINATGSKQALYNNGGTVVIKGNSLLTSISTNRATLHNLKNGSITILSGTVISQNQEAVKNESGTLFIGNNDGILNESIPTIQGYTYAVTGLGYSFYDGILKGISAAVENEGVITKDVGYEFVHDTEVIDSNTYNTLYLNEVAGKYRVIFNPNGGEVDITNKLIDQGNPIGVLPIPTKGVYTFDGWYTGLTDGVIIDENVIPTSNVTYYARWKYEGSASVVHDMVNDPMKVYYENISTWKNNESSFETSMKNNFNSYGCKCKDNTCISQGNVLCDRPVAYDTYLEEPLNVYSYDTDTNMVGNQVLYTNSDNGIIYNMIPGMTYYFEQQSNTDIHGLVTAQGERRLITIDGVQNVRDLGGLEVDSNHDGETDGVLKYGKLFRGEKLSNNQSSVTDLENLGITEEVDLRKESERLSGEVKFSNFKQRELIHYQIDRNHYITNYNKTRSVVTEVMQDVINGENIYFHCRIGADRTGTLAYILEGLLQVKDEERLQDYELTFFSGLVNRHRYYSTDPTSSVSKTEKFMYMYNFMTTSNDIYNWYMEGSTNVSADNQLIADFRTAMIDAV